MFHPYLQQEAAGGAAEVCRSPARYEHSLLGLDSPGNYRFQWIAKLTMLRVERPEVWEGRQTGWIPEKKFMSMLQSNNYQCR